MFKLLAGAFASAGMLFGGLFGGHPGPMPPNSQNASSTPFANIEGFFGHLFGGNASSTPPNGGHMGSTTPWQNGRMGSTTWQGGHGGPNASSTAMMMGSDVVGVVQSIDGTSLTVLGMQPMKMAPGTAMASTTFTVDASDARVIEKGNASSTVANIQIGDHVVVVGTVSGTSITAKAILDGIMPMMGGMGNGRPRPAGMHPGSSTPPLNQ